MFKSVEYVGFEGQPELKAKAEQATAVLGSVMRSWRDEVLVTWRPAPTSPAGLLELTLALDLPNARGSATGRIRAREFEPGEERYLRMSLTEVWLDLLDLLLAQMAAKREESVTEVVEA